MNVDFIKCVELEGTNKNALKRLATTHPKTHNCTKVRNANGYL